TVRLHSNQRRYVQEIDIVESVASSSDTGLEPLLLDSRVSKLDWRGVEQVEEIWVPSLDGTFTRERYFRNARWMNQPSSFRLVALDANGRKLRSLRIVHAGLDSRQRRSDDMFIRRFVARQSAFGCASVGDCTGASYVAEALVQLRAALEPGAGAVIPPATSELQVFWNRLPKTRFAAGVERAQAPGDPALKSGFQVQLATASSPDNGMFYVPGESVS